MDVVEINELTKIYDNRLVALNTVSLKLPQGSIMGLIGPNGAGKSTALMLILGLQKPTAGSVSVFGQPMALSSGDLRSRIGFLPQSGAFPPDMSCITYLDQIGKLFGIPHELRKKRLSSLLHATDLLQASSQRIDHLSSGQRTRLGIAAALINDPDLLILDEPTVGLDPEGRAFTISLISELRRAGKTIILSTHILPDADQVCDYVAVLNQGKLIFSGPVEDMKRIAYLNTVDLTVAGEGIDIAIVAIEAKDPDTHFERLGAETVRVAFQQKGDFSEALTNVLLEFSRCGVTLRAIRQVGELEDAFLKRLSEDRLRGFSRAIGKENGLAHLMQTDEAQPQGTSS
jgi:ABC-2 type transport system ATP-binding protein